MMVLHYQVAFGFRVPMGVPPLGAVFRQVKRGDLEGDSFSLSFSPWSMRYGYCRELKRKKMVVFVTGLPIYGWHEESMKFVFSRFEEILSVASNFERKADLEFLILVMFCDDPSSFPEELDIAIRDFVYPVHNFFEDFTLQAYDYNLEDNEGPKVQGKTRWWWFSKVKSLERPKSLQGHPSEIQR